MSKRFTHLLRNLTAAVALLLLAVWSYAAPAPAGTVVSNTAIGSYIDSATGLSFGLISNTVSTVVQTREALTLTATQTLSRSPGSPFEISHQLNNTGNAPANFVISISAAGGSFAPASVAIIQDLNGNGVFDAGEPVIPNNGTVTLPPGGAINLLVTGVVPASAIVGQSAQFNITATSQLQQIIATNTDTLVVVNGPAVAVTQSTSTDRPVAGGELSLTIRVANTGNGPASPVALTVDGVPTQLFILRSGIPANTTFSRLSSATSAAVLLYHRTGDPVNAYVTAQPAPQTIDGVAWALPALTGTEGPVISGSLVGTLSLRVNDNASGTISSVGFADFKSQGASLTERSNSVLLTLTDRPATIVFYATDAYAVAMRQAPIGAPLFVQVNAAQCNTNAGLVETHPVTLVSQLTGDSETFLATETAPNSGLFRILPNVPTANAASRVVASGNGILEVLRNDTVVASLSGCGSGVLNTALLIDPSGTVFDSKSNQPVAGVTVRLVDVTGSGNGGKAGGDATVFEADGTTPASATVVTQANGAYTFAFVPPSQYQLVLTTPNGYSFPSKLQPSVLPALRAIDARASYGQSFSVTVSGGAVVVDVPIDTGPASGLFVQKAVSKAVAEIGDFVNYSITVNNTTGIALKGVAVRDRLPAGFSYVRGSARLNGAVLQDPTGGGGPALEFLLGNIVASVQPVLVYRVRLGPGSEAGDGTNSAQVFSGVTQSNVATVKVRVAGGVFSNKSYLIGKVYADCNANRLQDAGEPGIPGVRIYLDNGTFAITDEEGKYSLYGLEPRTHVAKVDRSSLPEGVVLEITDNRNAGDSGSRFVDFKNGELQKADFAVSACTPALNELIKARRKALVGRPSEIDQAIRVNLASQATVLSDTKSLPASGVVGRSVQVDVASSASVRPASTAEVNPSAIETAEGFAPTNEAPLLLPTKTPTLESLLPTLTPALGFIDLKDGQVMPTSQTRVRVKGPLGSRFKLSVNGEPVSDKQVGEQSSLESVGVLAWDFVGVNLMPCGLHPLR